MDRTWRAVALLGIYFTCVAKRGKYRLSCRDAGFLHLVDCV